MTHLQKSVALTGLCLLGLFLLWRRSRRAQREKEDVLQELDRQPAFVRLSHPQFLMDRWVRQYGEEDALALAQWNNEPPSTILRIEQSAIDAAEFIDQLRAQD